MWRDFLYFPKQQKLGLLILAILIVALLAANIFIDDNHPLTHPEENEETIETQYQQFLASLAEKENLVKQKRNKNTTPFLFQKDKLFPFDPNRADSNTLTTLGMPRWMRNNLLRYREKGGYFKDKNDFKKLYGLTTENYNTLLPYLIITPKEKKVKSFPSLIDSSTIDTTAQRPHPIKFNKVVLINLNQADTTTLKKIPGIGSYIAKRIIDYRNRLGGYYDINQLKEIHLKADSLKQWFIINQQDIHKMNINKAGLNRLRAHPYINFYQAKAIVEYKKRKGEITTLKVFSLYEEFTPEDFERLSHYICYQ